MPMKKSRHKAAVRAQEFSESPEQIQTLANGKAKKALMGDFFLEDIHDYGVDRNNFIIYVGADPRHEGIDLTASGEPGIDFWMADRYVKNLKSLSKIDRERPIEIVIATCGGCAKAGMRMFKATHAVRNPTTGISTDDARSMSSIFPLAFDKWLMWDSAKYMMHKGHEIISGTSQEVETNYRESLKDTYQMLLLYATRLSARGTYARRDEKENMKRVRDWMQRDSDVWFDAHQALRLGLIDGIISVDDESQYARKKNEARQKIISKVLNADIMFEVKLSHEYRR